MAVAAMANGDDDELNANPPTPCLVALQAPAASTRGKSPEFPAVPRKINPKKFRANARKTKKNTKKHENTPKKHKKKTKQKKKHPNFFSR